MFIPRSECSFREARVDSVQRIERTGAKAQRKGRLSSTPPKARPSLPDGRPSLSPCAFFRARCAMPSRTWSFLSFLFGMATVVACGEESAGTNDPNAPAEAPPPPGENPNPNTPDPKKVDDA